MRQIYRIINAFKLGRWGFQNPGTVKHFNILSDIFRLIMKVAQEHRHMMTRVAQVHPDGEQEEIVTIWAGAGINADPTERIKELMEENQKLKKQLKDCVENKEL